MNKQKTENILNEVSAFLMGFDSRRYKNMSVEDVNLARMRYLDGLTYKEIGKRENRCASGVKKCISRVAMHLMEKEFS